MVVIGKKSVKKSPSSRKIGHDPVKIGNSDITHHGRVISLYMAPHLLSLKGKAAHPCGTQTSSFIVLIYWLSDMQASYLAAVSHGYSGRWLV